MDQGIRQVADAVACRVQELRPPLKESRVSTNRTAVRQGDVLLIPVDRPTGKLATVEPENERLILERGEVTGHHHSVSMYDRVAMFRDTTVGTLYLNVEQPTKLEQLGEGNVWEPGMHTPVDVAEGLYEVRAQRTMTSTGLIRQVAD